jgi:signal transduction protein with GAF and PtsI domain
MPMQRLSSNSLVKALTTIGKAINSEQYLDDVLQLIVTVTAQLMSSNICSLMLIDPKEGVLVIRATQSISDQYISKPPLKIGEGIAGKVAKTMKPIMVLDVTKEPEYKYQDIAKKEGLRSLICVPLSIKGVVIGVLNCYTSEEHHFLPKEIDILTTVANQAALSIENYNLILQRKLIHEELETRKRLDIAKGLIMKDMGITEAEAYSRIKKYAMDNRKPILEIAELVITADEIKSPKKTGKN